MTNCGEKAIIALTMIFGGLTFLLPSMLTTYTYLTKWIPEEPDPVKKNQMKAILIVSAAGGIGLTTAGMVYLKREKCI